MSFDNAKKFVKKLNLSKLKDWASYNKYKLPFNFPSNPESVYKREWNGWGDFLGTGTISYRKRNWKPFGKARLYVRKLKLKSANQYQKLVRLNKISNDMPINANFFYKKKGWVGWGDFLGTGKISREFIKYKSFKEARKFVIKLKLKSGREWKVYCRSGKKPLNIPGNPRRTYKKKVGLVWEIF